LLVTGHTHDLFVNFDDKCALVESGYDAHYVTCVDLAISVREDNGKRTTTWWPQFRVTDTATVAPDPEVAAAVARFEKVLLDKMTEPICTTAVALDSSTSTLRTREAAIGNLFADAMRVSTRADVAILNGGGIRANKTYEPGARISQGDVLAELPFGNRIVVLETSGRDLKSAIENGLSKLPQSSGRFPQVSGITVEFSLDREPGNRVTAMRVGGAPLDESRSYRVATLDFLARGGDEYTMFTNARRITPDNDAPLMVNEVVAYLRGLQTVRTGVEGRMVGR
jgi:2',3'-cyclic-nucleotide 2'-phosphodiesterase (5'-nucleotidase family)